MINLIIEEWKSFTRYQKIVLTIYFIISLPLMPFFAIVIPFANWITTGKGMPVRRLTIIDFLSQSTAFSLFGYLCAILIYCTK
jgi:hypothetical protein